MHSSAQSCTCPNGSLVIDGTDSDGITISEVFPNTNSHFNFCTTVKGKLIIDKDFTFLGGEMVMEAGAEIVVNATRSLTIRNVNQDEGLHGCEKMWKGITLLSQANLEIDYSTVKDAQYAVRCHGNNGLRLTDNVFDRNYISISTPSTISNPVTNLGIRDNLFTCTSALLAAFPGQSPAPPANSRSYAGIEIYNIDFTLDADINAPEVNEFCFLRNGIIIHNARLRVLDAIIQKLHTVTNITMEEQITPQVLYDGVAIAADNGSDLTALRNTIHQVRRGIMTISSRTNVQTNSITECIYGVVALSAPVYSIVAGNQPIDFQLRGIYVSSPTTCYNLIVKGNLLNGIYQNSAFPNTRGVAVTVTNLEGYCEATPEVSENTINITTKFNGIEIDINEYDANANGNTITYETDPYLTLTKGATGITLRNTLNYRVKNNTVTTDGQDPVAATGLRFINTPRTTVCENTTEYVGTGIHFNMPCQRSAVRRNNMNNYSMGLVYAQAAWVGEQDNQANQWLYSSFTNGGALHISSSQALVSANRYKIEQCNSSGDWPSIIKRRLRQHHYLGIATTALPETARIPGLTRPKYNRRRFLPAEPKRQNRSVRRGRCRRDGYVQARRKLLFPNRLLAATDGRYRAAAGC